jgi:hypothetical protein
MQCLLFLLGITHGGASTKVSLCQGWKYAIEPRPPKLHDPDAQNPAPTHCWSGGCNESTDDSGWPVVTVPHDFMASAPYTNSSRTTPYTQFALMNRGYVNGTAAWYRRHIELPLLSDATVMWLEFEGVYRDSQIYLNNELLSTHLSGYGTICVNLTQRNATLRQGANLLAVFADARISEGWWYEVSISIGLSRSRLMLFFLVMNNALSVCLCLSLCPREAASIDQCGYTLPLPCTLRQMALPSTHMSKAR